MAEIAVSMMAEADGSCGVWGKGVSYPKPGGKVLEVHRHRRVPVSKAYSSVLFIPG